MSNYYTEHLVKQNATGKTKLMQMLIIVVAAVLIVAMFLFGILSIPFIGLFLPIGVIALAVWLYRKNNLEFEYLFIDGELDIDKIINQSKRKRVLSTSAKDMEIMAPVNSYEANNYKDLKEIDCSSHEPHATVYILVAQVKGERVKVLFEPNKVIIDGMRLLAPRKVIL